MNRIVVIVWGCALIAGGLFILAWVAHTRFIADAPATGRPATLGPMMFGIAVALLGGFRIWSVRSPRGKQSSRPTRKLEFTPIEGDRESWVVDAYRVAARMPPIEVYATTDGERPTEEMRRMIARTLESVDHLVLAAASRILENYSTEHFRSIGVQESQLLEEETPEAVANAVTLVAVGFHDEAGSSFELSFTVPWDDGRHSYDVGFEGGVAVNCSVNG